MKRIPVILLIVIVSFLNIYSQERPSISNRNFSIYGIIASIKGGGISGDRFLADYSDYYTFDIPPGGSAEFTIEYPIGKFFYAGLNVNGWYSQDRVTDNELGTDVKRRSYGFHFCPMIKYRYLIKKTSIDFSGGIGRSLVITKFAETYYNNNIDMTNLCGNIGVDHFIGDTFFITGEVSYYFLFGGYNARGDDRSNQMFIGKLGIGLVFPLKQRR